MTYANFFSVLERQSKMLQQKCKNHTKSDIALAYLVKSAAKTAVSFKNLFFVCALQKH